MNVPKSNRVTNIKVAEGFNRLIRREALDKGFDSLLDYSRHVVAQEQQKKLEEQLNKKKNGWI